MPRKNDEFKKFMEYKKIKYLDNISSKHIGYKHINIGTKSYLFELLKDKKYGTIMYNLKELKFLKK